MASGIDDLAEGKMKPWHHVPKVRCLHITWVVPAEAGLVPGPHLRSLISRRPLAPIGLPLTTCGSLPDLDRGDDGA